MFSAYVAQIWGKSLLAPTQPINSASRNLSAAPVDLFECTAVQNILYVSLFVSHFASLRALYEECVEEMTRASRGSPEEDTDETEGLALDSDGEGSDELPVAHEEGEETMDAEERPARSEIGSSIASETESPVGHEDRALAEAEAESETAEQDDGAYSDLLEDAVITEDGPEGESERSDLDATDRRLLSIKPSSDYVETPRQEALSADEMELYSLMYGAEDSPVGAGETVALGRQLLDNMISRAATVRETYVGSLNVPQEKDHAACRDLLRVMGVPIVIARIPYEAEGLASTLVLRGQADFVGSEDSDVIVYGVSFRVSKLFS